MPTSMIAAISNVVATGRRINGRDGLMERNYAGTLTDRRRQLIGCRADARRPAPHPAVVLAAGLPAELRLLPNPPADRLGRQPAAVPCRAGRRALRRRACSAPR